MTEVHEKGFARSLFVTVDGSVFSRDQDVTDYVRSLEAALRVAAGQYTPVTDEQRNEWLTLLQEQAMHATPDDTLAQWIVVEEAGQPPWEVNAFVGAGDAIPNPALYDNGYKLAVGENPRVTIEVQRRG